MALAPLVEERGGSQNAVPESIPARGGGGAGWTAVLSSLCVLSVCGLLVASGVHHESEMLPHAQYFGLRTGPHTVAQRGVIRAFTRSDHRFAKLVRQTDALNSRLHELALPSAQDRRGGFGASSAGRETKGEGERGLGVEGFAAAGNR